jgi:hypothetical protein
MLFDSEKHAKSRHHVTCRSKLASGLVHQLFQSVSGLSSTAHAKSTQKGIVDDGRRICAHSCGKVGHRGLKEGAHSDGVAANRLKPKADLATGLEMLSSGHLLCLQATEI